MIGELAGHHVQVDAERLADHARRVDHGALPVQRVAGRQGVEHGPAGADAVGAGGLEHPLDVAARDGAGADVHPRLEMLRGEPAARHVDDDRLDLDLGHPLGGVNRLTDRALGGGEVDDGAALQTEGALVADADDAREVRAAAERGERLGGLQLGDEADHLARADVEHREGGRTPGGERLQARREAVLAVH
jgi:hypothetical protein